MRNRTSYTVCVTTYLPGFADVAGTRTVVDSTSDKTAATVALAHRTFAQKVLTSEVKN